MIKIFTKYILNPLSHVLNSKKTKLTSLFMSKRFFIEEVMIPIQQKIFISISHMLKCI